MRGKLKVPVGRPFVAESAGFGVKINLASTDSAIVASPVRGAAPWIAGVLAVFTASSALPQGNIDAGKSPAQMFADTCSNCHRRPSELKRGASTSFLRQHYTPGSQEAAAMASYLAGIPADSRGGKERERAKEKTKTQQPAQERPQERPKGAQQAQQQQPKGKRPELAKSAAEPPPEAPAETRVEAATIPKLEPFEE
jgi:hypothetical protein